MAQKKKNYNSVWWSTIPPLPYKLKIAKYTITQVSRVITDLHRDLYDVQTVSVYKSDRYKLQMMTSESHINAVYERQFILCILRLLNFSHLCGEGIQHPLLSDTLYCLNRRI